MIKPPPANAGDMGSIPDPGRSPEPSSSYARLSQLLSLCLEPGSCNHWSPGALETALCKEAPAPHAEPPHSPQVETKPAWQRSQQSQR